MRPAPIARFTAGVWTAFGAIMCRPRLRSKINDLAGIHDVERIERALDRAHRRKRRLAVLGQQIFHLALADAMLAGAGAVHGQRTLDQALRQRLRASDLVGVVHVDEQRQMEVAVADMADDRRQEPALGNVALGLDDAFGKPRYRHADIGRDNLRARPQRLARQRGVMAGLPQTGTILLARRPVERPAAELARDVGETFRLLGYTRLGAMEFQ